ncbi:saccharopine dehydrogenase family protein [Janthinobacterium sp. HLX7-2]|uniref:saccharopine dehydrogenase family protein n=1 Tax=Janthinobacterium sp. HLX7-2 TaxID=1259331 RepID=UPI003F27DA88
MSNNYPIVVYGASGYTGRLIVEFLREYGVPFVAAGRNRARIEEAMRTVPGIEDAQYEIVEVEHSVEALTKLFEGRRVVCNTVGPFTRKAPVVIEAALRAGCHYLDTTGEQASMIDIEAQFGERFEKAGLALVSSLAYMYAVSEITARVCLETEGIDSLDMFAYGVAVPTQASTESIFDVVRNKAHYLADRKLVEYDRFQVSDMQIPGGLVLKGMPWGGTANPVWFRHDPRVRNCRMTVALSNQEIYKRILELARAFKVQLQWIPEDQLIPVLDKMAATMTPSMPPRESRHVHRAIDWCHGRGNNVAASCIIYSTGGYLMTGALQAYAAKQLAYGEPRAVGFKSPSEVFGHRELLGALKAFGLASMSQQHIV